jgi:hypothetical protein
LTSNKLNDEINLIEFFCYVINIVTHTHTFTGEWRIWRRWKITAYMKYLDYLILMPLKYLKGLLSTVVRQKNLIIISNLTYETVEN